MFNLNVLPSGLRLSRRGVGVFATSLGVLRVLAPFMPPWPGSSRPTHAFSFPQWRRLQGGWPGRARPRGSEVASTSSHTAHIGSKTALRFEGNDGKTSDLVLDSHNRLQAFAAAT